MSGVVVSAEGPLVRVDADGEVRRWPVRPHVGRLIPGDHVSIAGGRVDAGLPRSTVLERADPRRPGRREPIVANVDLGVVVASIGDPPLRPGLIDRYRVALGAAGIELAIFVNKCEGADPATRADAEAALAGFRAAGVPIVFGSARSGQGLDEIRGLLQGRTAVFVGHSGVGKSSLLNALAGTALGVGGVSAGTGKGRHTTRAAVRIRLDETTAIIDTPGVREFGLAADPAAGFPEFAAFAPECRFRDCRHDREPGCAVRDAARDGRLDGARYDAYRRLIADAAEEPPSSGEPSPPSFRCASCGRPVVSEGAGTGHRNHCPHCLHSVHLDQKPGDRRAACGADMEPVAVWVRQEGEWALIHRCTGCGVLHSNRIAADDHPGLLIDIAMRPMGQPPFPLGRLTMACAE